jgi:hypothetical protein
MKRTRDVTFVHYRRSVRRSSPRDLHGYCPVCGSLLAVVVNDSGDTWGVGSKVVERTVFRVVRDDPEGGLGRASQPGQTGAGSSRD